MTTLLAPDIIRKLVCQNKVLRDYVLERACMADAEASSVLCEVERVGNE